MPRTLVQRVGQGSASLLALVLWCSSCNGLIGGMMTGSGEANYFRDYKRLGSIAKLATSYMGSGGDRALGHSPSNSSTILPLQRHFSVLTKFAHVESRLSGHKRQREVVFYAPVNLCDRRACSASVAVGLWRV